MRLKVLLPTEVLLAEEVRKVSAEADDGELTLLPRHGDLATTLAAGVLSFEPLAGSEQFLAVSGGVMIKCGEEVLVSARRAVRGTELGSLREQVRREFLEVDEHEAAASRSLKKIEATFVHRFIELEHGYE